MSTTSLEEVKAQKFAEDILRLSVTTYARLFRSSRLLQSISAVSLNSHSANHMSFDVSSCDDRSLAVRDHGAWSDIFSSDEFAVSTAMDCITDFIHCWEFTKEWNFHVFPNKTDDSLRFDVVFSLSHLDRCHFLDTCTVYFDIRGKFNVVSYRFEDMSTEYSVDARMFMFQEHILLTIIGHKRRVPMLELDSDGVGLATATAACWWRRRTEWQHSALVHVVHNDVEYNSFL